MIADRLPLTLLKAFETSGLTIHSGQPILSFFFLFLLLAPFGLRLNEG